MSQSYERPNLRISSGAVEYRRSDKEDWRFMSTGSVTHVRRLAYRVWNVWLTLLALAVFIGSCFMESPMWMAGLILGFVIVVIAIAVGPKRWQLVLETTEGEIKVLDTAEKREVDEAYDEVYYLVLGRYPKVEHVSQFDEMVKRIQSESRKSSGK